jgi:hypothetical protein
MFSGVDSLFCTRYSVAGCAPRPFVAPLYPGKGAITDLPNVVEEHRSKGAGCEAIDAVARTVPKAST